MQVCDIEEWLMNIVILYSRHASDCYCWSVYWIDHSVCIRYVLWSPTYNGHSTHVVLCTLYMLHSSRLHTYNTYVTANISWCIDVTIHIKGSNTSNFWNFLWTVGFSLWVNRLLVICCLSYNTRCDFYSLLKRYNVYKILQRSGCLNAHPMDYTIRAIDG